MLTHMPVLGWGWEVQHRPPAALLATQRPFMFAAAGLVSAQGTGPHGDTANTGFLSPGTHDSRSQLPYTAPAPPNTDQN